MHRDEKINDAVRKKPKKEPKTNQKKNKNDGVLKTNVVRFNFLKKERKIARSLL